MWLNICADLPSCGEKNPTKQMIVLLETDSNTSDEAFAFHQLLSRFRFEGFW